MNFVSASSVGLIENSTWQSNLNPIRYGSSSAGDINGDDNMDIILTGCLSVGGLDCDAGVISKIYINNGITLTESSQWQQNLTGLGWSSSTFGDIDNDGDLDLSLIGCTSATSTSGCTGNLFSKIYINNGTSLVESQQWQQNLTGTFDGSIAFGDINNDGKLDLALTGDSGSKKIVKIYINNGTTLTESSQWQQNLTAVRSGALVLGDIDKDGDLDLALTGEADGVTSKTKIYINNGTSLIENQTWQQNLIATQDSSVVFGDIDNDGDLDLALIGVGDYLFIYKNNGTTFLERQKNSGEGGDLGGGLFDGSIAFGDYDNDGDLDFVGMGLESGRNAIYENNESKNYNFSIDIVAGNNFTNNDMHNGPLVWVDLDNDKDLDLISIGTNSIIGILAKVYINNNTAQNTKPAPPTSGFSSSYVNNFLTLSWGNGSDTETNTSGLYYNLHVGNSTNNNSIVSGVYGGSSGGGTGGGGASGYFGNMMQRKSISLNVELEANKTYYWYVQTIDTGLAKSNWSVMQSFNTSLDTTKPEITINYPSPNQSLHTTNPYFIFNVTVIDANLTNVTLYANWNGSWYANETNSSGINGTYVFIRNLTNYNDNLYSWYIYACDKNSNCQTSEIRTFYLDRAYPIVKLVSPVDAGTWTSSSTVTFSYNVSDIDIANCSLIINNATDQTNITITEDTTQTFSKTLSNAVYTWQVNCTDYVGYTNSSSIRSLTVSYTAPSNGGNSGGGSGGTVTPAIIQKFDIDFSKENSGSFSAKQGDIKTFSFNSEIKHTITIMTLTTDSITFLILSDPITIQIKTGEIKQIDIDKDNINDIEIKLISIINGKASFSLKKLAGADIVGKEELEEAIRKEVLFDVKVYILDKFKEVFPGEEVSAKIEVFNTNNIGKVDVVVNYYLSDSNLSNGTILAKGFDTLAVEAVTSFVRSLVIPDDLKPGIYYFNVDVSYKNFTTSGNAEFKVKSKKLIFIEKKWKEIVIVTIGAAALITIVLFVYLRMIKKREEKIEEEEQKIKKKESKLEKKEARLEKIIKRFKKSKKWLK